MNPKIEQLRQLKQQAHQGGGADKMAARDWSGQRNEPSAGQLSVIVQVVSFKTRGKRVLRCAPLHHHYQFGGMPESRLVVRAWIVASLLAMSSLALFKVR